MNDRYGRILILMLGLALTVVIIWYNTNLYIVHEKGLLNDEWFLIFLVIPFFQLLMMSIMVAKRKTNNS